MQLQYSVSICKREGNYVVNGAHTLFQKIVLNGVNPLSYRGYVEQSSPFPLRIVSIVYRTSMYVVDDNLGSYQRCRGLDGWLLCRLSLPTNCANILF